MYRELRSLAAEELAIGGGPLFFAGLAAFAAVRADDATERWLCVAVAAHMLVLCAIYLVWAVRRSRRHVDSSSVGGQHGRS